MCELSKAHTAYAELAHIGVGSAADFAAIITAGGKLGFSLLLEFK
jgi:hypothetical protein